MTLLTFSVGAVLGATFYIIYRVALGWTTVKLKDSKKRRWWAHGLILWALALCAILITVRNADLMLGFIAGAALAPGFDAARRHPRRKEWR